MNIWCISKYAGIPEFGTGARLFYLTKEFIKLGHAAKLFTSDSNHLVKFPETKRIYNHETIEGVSVSWIKTKKYSKTASVERVLSWLDFEAKLFRMDIKTIEKPDVVIVSSLSLFSIFFGLYLKRKFSSFLVFEVRDIWPLTMTEEGGFSRLHPLVLMLGFIETLGYKKSDLIVGTMPRLDLHVRNILGYDRPFYCSPLGFDPSKYNDTKQLSSEFDEFFPEDKVVIGYAGSMGITNSLGAFIDAIGLLKDNDKIHFMLVGGGDFKSKYEEQLKHCNNVTFLPKIGQEQVSVFLSKCDILYLSTQDSEIWNYGQSMNKVVEYMLAGKPIIASYTGYPSMIDEANCGEFVSAALSSEVKEVLLKYANLGRSELEKIGQRGKTWIQARRAYSRLAKEYLSKIEEIMGLQKTITDGVMKKIPKN